MIFSAPIFLAAFLPSVLFFYFSLPWKNTILLCFSLIFYAWGEPTYLFLLLASTGINYFLAILISRYKKINKLLITTGIVMNLSALAVFKYLGFIIGNINQALSVCHIPTIPMIQLPLPLGISFFTFHAISYLIDVYRGDCKAEKNIENFSLYMALFPHLVAGPIVRFREISERIRHRTVDLSLFSRGIERFIAGFAKKVLIADTLALSVDLIFQIPSKEIPGFLAWTGSFLFALQIYFDFSGYTDMAVGLANMFGFEFPENFNFPYTSQSIREFWKRWHMTLSRWLRDYLYFPMGGNRAGKLRTFFNLTVVFFLCGLWHGASWTFVVWGLWHGFFLMLEHTKFSSVLERFPSFLRRAYVLFVVLVSWVFFRSTSIRQAIHFIEALSGAHGWTHPAHPVRLYADALTMILAAVGCATSLPAKPWLDKMFQKADFLSRAFGIVYAGRFCYYSFIFIITLSVMAFQTHRAFIYFRF